MNINLQLIKEVPSVPKIFKVPKVSKVSKVSKVPKVKRAIKISLSPSSRSQSPLVTQSS